MRVDAPSDELDTRLQDEIAGHPLPHEPELVAFGPHVHAARGQAVLLRNGVVDGGSGDLRRADVPLAVEVTDRTVRH
jgi:hypothetical protein